MQLLNRLVSFFSCVLDANIDNCAAIATSSRFYNFVLASLRITDIGNHEYKINADWLNASLGFCDSMTTTLNGANNKITMYLEHIMSAQDVQKAKQAYNLNKFIKSVGNIFTNKDGLYSGLKQTTVGKFITRSWDEIIHGTTVNRENIFTQHDFTEDYNQWHIAPVTEIDGNGNITVNGVTITTGLPENYNIINNSLQGSTLTVSTEADLSNINEVIVVKDNNNKDIVMNLYTAALTMWFNEHYPDQVTENAKVINNNLMAIKNAYDNITDTDNIMTRY